MINSVESRGKKVSSIMLTTLTLLIAVLYLIPFLVAVVTSFKTPLETAESVFSLPNQLQWQNYMEAIKVSNMGNAIKNSLIITSFSVFFITLFATMGGYVIARNSKQKVFKFTEKLYLAALMVPAQVIMVPLYKMFKGLGLMNSLFGMILFAVGSSIPYATFLIIGFAKSVPKELEEAAQIDGCSPIRAFFTVVIPMLKPIISVVASLHVLWIWNEFNMSLIILQKEAVRTVPIQQYFFFGQYSSNFNTGFAAAIISMIPILLFFVFIQKYLVEGISAGAVKG